MSNVVITKKIETLEARKIIQKTRGFSDKFTTDIDFTDEVKVECDVPQLQLSGIAFNKKRHNAILHEMLSLDYQFALKFVF